MRSPVVRNELDGLLSHGGHLAQEAADRVEFCGVERVHEAAVAGGQPPVDLARPSAGPARRLLAWETGGRPLDPDWLAVAAAGADLGRPHIVLPRVPTPAELAGLAMPALVVVAARSRAHDPAQIAARARERLPEVTVESLAQATHHTIPTEDADELTGYLAGFLVSGTPAAGA